MRPPRPRKRTPAAEAPATPAGEGTATSSGPQAGADDRLLRNDRKARRLHAATYLLTGFLLLSGVAVLGEGLPSLERILGGHAWAARWHRWLGFALAVLPVAVVTLRPRVVRRFLADSLTFARTDAAWVRAYPRFLLAPRRNAPARHGGHFDPGQRVMNVVLVLSLVALTLTGIVMSFPERITPAAFAWSLGAHRVSTIVLVLALAGHIVVASGILPAYRGVWRAMHGDGRVPARLAARLWPAWTEAQRRRVESGPRQPDG